MSIDDKLGTRSAGRYWLLACSLIAACSSKDATAGNTAGTGAGVESSAAGASAAGTSAGAGSGAGTLAGSSGTSGSDAAVDTMGSDGGNADAASSNADAASDAGTSLPGFTLAWSDEFDGPAGSLPDDEKWVFEVGGHGFGNNELQFHTDRADNAALDGNGQLVITARKESYMGRDYTSARLKTAGTFEHTYGRYEARLKLPQGQGIWPAFWMLGNDIGTAGWPSCGEIDIMENIGREPSTVHGTLHGPGYSGGSGVGDAFELDGDAKFADAFHVFAVEWEEAEMRWYVDGALYQTRKPSDLPGDWVYDHPFFIILNLAVGGQWPGNPDGTTTFPQTLTIDYVRVYDAAQ